MLKTGQGQRVLLAGERTAVSSFRYLLGTPQEAKLVSSFGNAEACCKQFELLDVTSISVFMQYSVFAYIQECNITNSFNKSYFYRKTVYLNFVVRTLT